MEPNTLFNAIWDPTEHCLRVDRVAPGAASSAINDGHGILADLVGGTQNFTDTLRVVGNEGAAG
jgi:hypothetical protein